MCLPFMRCPPRLERHPRAEREEAHLVERDVGNLAEQRAGRIHARALPLLAIEQVLGVHPELPRAAAAGAEVALDRQVGKRQRHPAHAVDAEREGALLEGSRDPRRIAFESCVDVEPLLACRVIERDVVEVSAEENILTPQSSNAPGWYSQVPVTCQLPASAASTPPSCRNRRPRPKG